MDTQQASAVEPKSMRKNRRVWIVLLCIGYPLAILLPYYIAFVVNRVPMETQVPFNFMDTLLSTSGILFGFSSLIIISKEWVDRRVWVVLIPPLALLIVSGVYVGNLALGFANQVEVLVLCSSTFNANVVSTGFIIGYIVQKLPYRGR